MRTIYRYGDGDGNLRLDRHDDPARPGAGVLGGAALDRFDSILQDIDQRLGDEARIAMERYRPRRKARLKRDLGVRRTLEEDRLLDDRRQVRYRFASVLTDTPVIAAPC